MTPGTRTHDHELVEAVETLYQNPENRDAAEGGVPHTIVADHVGIHESTAKGRLRDLVNEGRLQHQDGLEPDTMRWRRSYAPLDAEESHEGEGGWTTPS
jgi:hypothetical protein